MIKYIQSLLDSMALALYARREIIELRGVLSDSDARLSDEVLIERSIDIVRIMIAGGHTLESARHSAVIEATTRDRFS